MKKLMTMLSAATVAIGLYAYDDTGTSFEGATTGTFDLATPDDLGDATGYWGSDTNTWEVVAGESIRREEAIGDENAFPNQFASANQAKYLKIASAFGNPLTRYVNNDKTSGVNTEDAPLFFDSLVKFTAFDYGDLPLQVTNELESAKIAVWIQAVDDEGTQTNLYVRAGKFVNGQVQPWTYNCGEFDNADAWHRLTIKAMGSIYENHTAPGFAVFVNNKMQVTTDETGIDKTEVADTCIDFINDSNCGLFPSMDQTSPNNTMITSVSFDGQGGIDDVVFTQTPPFKNAESTAIATITWNPDTTHIASITIGGNVYSNGTAKIKFNPDDQTGVMSVTIEGITYADGWTGPASKEITIDDSKAYEIADDVATEIVAYFGDAAYTNLTEAVNAAITAADPTVALKLNKTTSLDQIYTEASEVAISIDLNGQTIGQMVAPLITVTLVDSSDVIGKVEGFVMFAEGSTITGGAFIGGDVNTKEALNVFAPEGYEFVDGEGDYKGYLVLAKMSEVTKIAVPTAATDLVYDGTEQTGVAAGEGYELTGDVAATNAGEYTATATPKAGYAWVGGSTDATNITWSIAKAQVTATVSLTVTEATYDSEKNTVTAYTTPSVNFGLDAPELVENTDYTVAWSATEVTGAGTFTYTVSPVQGSNYTFTEASATLTITAGGGGLDPEDGTVEVVINDAQDGDDAIAKAKAAIVAPTGATVDTAVYADYFTYNAAGEAGTYTVTITGVKDEIKADVLGSAVERLTNAEATIVEVPAGLYYSITPSTSLPISGTATKGLSTGGTVEVGKPGSTAGFYEIKLSATPIND